MVKYCLVAWYLGFPVISKKYNIATLIQNSKFETSGKRWNFYSAYILFMHQPTVRLPVPGGKNTHGKRQKKAKHIIDPRCLRIKDTFSCEIIYTSMPRKVGGDQACGRVVCPAALALNT